MAARSASGSAAAATAALAEAGATTRLLLSPLGRDALASASESDCGGAASPSPMPTTRDDPPSAPAATVPPRASLGGDGESKNPAGLRSACDAGLNVIAVPCSGAIAPSDDYQIWETLAARGLPDLVAAGLVVG